MPSEDALDLPHAGDPQVDEAHELQVRLLESIEKALGQSDREGALELLKTLEDYTDAHFAAEQILMRLHSYPAYYSHISEHGRLLEEFEVLRKRISSVDEDVLPAEAETVRRWVVTHIRTADRAFVAYLKESPIQR